MNSESAREEADPGFAQGWSQFGFGDTLVQICNLQICTKRVLHEDGPYPKAVKRWYNSERLLHWNDIGCSEHSSCVHFSWSQGILQTSRKVDARTLFTSIDIVPM